MKTLLLISILLPLSALAQVTVPEGTKLYLQLNQKLSSADAVDGQLVEFTVAEDVLVNGVVAIPHGSRATGTVLEAMPKRRMGRAGHLQFSIDRVQAPNKEWLALRPTPITHSGESHALSTGIITGVSVAALGVPGAIALLRKGKDITYLPGARFESFTQYAYATKTDALPKAVVERVAAESTASR